MVTMAMMMSASFARAQSGNTSVRRAVLTTTTTTGPKSTSIATMMSVVRGRRAPETAKRVTMTRATNADGSDATSTAAPGTAPALTDAADANASTPRAPDRRAVLAVESGPLQRPPLGVAGALASFGALESTYLAIQKLTGGDVACPVGGCQTALNSGYAELFGAPLSAYGAVAYALVAALAFWGNGIQKELVAQGENRDRTLESSYARARVLLFFGATGLAGVSSYLLFVLAVKLGGVECVYCLTSAALSLTLFGVGFAGLSSKESGKALPAAIALYLVTLASMSIVLTGGDGDKASTAGMKLEYAQVKLDNTSTQYSRALAKHLADTGAKMYGAFWCSHCIEQKEYFGSGAEIPYVECFPDGCERGTPVAKSCDAAKVEGFPTWIINGKKIEGEQTLEELAKLSGFQGQNDAASMVADLF